MAVLVSNGPTSLATANGFYRAEAFNLGMFSTTDLALSTTRTIAVTFANAGNCQGLILALTCAAMTATLKSVVVTLQENVAAVWTDRATVTLSAATIANNVANAQSDGWIVTFTGGTFPYAVTTAAGTWRFQISQTGAQANNWSIRTSDATNPFYVTWCDNALSFASNDVLVCKDVVTIDQTATLKGVLGTGETTRSVCAIVCRSTTPTPAAVSNLVWAASPAASYTLTLDGLLILGSHSGFRIGTAASPIPLAQQAIINVIAATSGTATITGFSTPEHRNGFAAQLNNLKSSIFMFGEVPATRWTRLNASAATGQPNIVTTASTGWPTGTRLFVGGFTTRGMGEATVFSINTIAGANIGLSANLGTTARSAGGYVARLDSYGVFLKGPAANGIPEMPIGAFSNFQMRGVHQQFLAWRKNYPASVILDDAANTEACFVDQCLIEMSSTLTGLNNLAFFDWGTWQVRCDFTNSVYVNVAIGAFPVTPDSETNYSVTGNIVLRPGITNGNSLNISQGFIGAISNNVFEGGNGPQIVLNGVNVTYSGNRHWGCSSSIGAVRLLAVINPNGAANTYDNNSVGIYFDTTITGGVFSNCTFGTEVANASDLGNLTNAYANITLESPTGNLSLLSPFITNALPGSHIRVSDFNDTTNDDRGFLKFGNYQRTGSGLTDTTARTAGGFAMRLAPNSGTSLLAWPNLVSERAVPTGNIQNKTMTVTAWVYINNAAFYAGTHTKPTLSVKYDNATTASAVATATAGSWQQLAVTFTPTTTYGQIEVWFSGATDATGANAYFYVDDVQVAYPAGVSINLGGLDLWANATPVWPPIATFPALGGVWDEATSAHVVPGSFAALLANALTDPETGYPQPRVLRIIAAAVAGKTSGGPAGFVARNLTDTADQIAGSSDASGNRSSAVYGS